MRKAFFAAFYEELVGDQGRILKKVDRANPVAFLKLMVTSNL